MKTRLGYITDCYAKPLWADKIQEEKACGFWYLSHHGVVNPKKPGKFCIVFDCASTFQGKSINNHMYTGPDVLNTLICVFFRQKRVAIVGDVTEIYYCVKVYKEDERFLRFLWWKERNIDEKANHF